jgi:predicted HTH domain antitoxin
MSSTIEDSTEFRIELPLTITAEEARLALAIRLFEKGRVSLGQGSRMAGFSVRAFIDVLGREGVAVVNYPASELVQELGK